MEANQSKPRSLSHQDLSAARDEVVRGSGAAIGFPHARWVRLGWTLLLALHLFSLVSALAWKQEAEPTAAADTLVCCVALLGSIGFFILKIADVSWLRLRPGVHSWVAVTAVVALMHVNAVERAVLHGNTTSPLTFVAMLAGGSVIDAGAARRSGLLWLSTFWSSVPQRPRTPMMVRRWSGWFDNAWALRHCFLAFLGSPRAPPFRTA